jgi:hypothetical protein
MIYHSGPRVQRGRGLGSILSGLFRSFAPVAKLGLNFGKKLISSPLAQKVGSAAMEAAKKSAVNIAADVMSGHNVKESAQRELRDAKEKIATTLRAGRKKRAVETSKRLKKNPKQIVKSKKKKYCILD